MMADQIKTNPTISSRFWQALRKAPAPYIVPLFAFPLFLLAINNSWVFPPTSWIDAWIYSGYHLHIGRLLQDTPSAYYGSRVPWTVLGWVIHRVASPEMSLYALALLLVYASTFSLFYVIYTLFSNGAAAFIAACLLSTNSFFLFAAGWNYVDGPLIACIFLSLAALVEAARGRYWRTAAVLWGAVTAAMLAIYLINAILLPIEILIFAALDRLAFRRLSPSIALRSVLGFAGALVAMGFANRMVGGSINFLAPTLAVLGAITPSATKDVYYEPWNEWLPSASWMILPGIITIASVAFAMVRSKSILVKFRQIATSPELAREASLVIFAAAYILLLLGLGFMQLLHWDMLSLFFRANTLLPFAYFIVGGFLALSLSRASARFELGFAASAAIICIAPWLLGAAGVIHAPLPFFPPIHSPTQIMVRPAVILYGDFSEAIWILAGAALLLGMWIFPFRILLLLPVAFFSLLSIATISTDSGIRVPEDAGVSDRSLAAFDAAGIIDKNVTERFVLWWYPEEPDEDIFLSLGSMYLQPTPAHFGPGDRVIFLGSSELPPKSARPLLARNHLILEGPIRKEVQRGTVAFGLDIARLALDPQFFGKTELSMASMASPMITVPSPGFSNAGVNVTTPAQAWAYGAVLRIPQEVRSAHPSGVFMRVRLRVNSGDMGVGITTKDGTAWVDRKFIHSSPIERDVYLTIPALKDAGDLVFCSNGANVASTASVRSVSILYEKATARAEVGFLIRP